MSRLGPAMGRSAHHLGQLRPDRGYGGAIERRTYSLDSSHLRTFRRDALRI